MTDIYTCPLPFTSHPHVQKGLVKFLAINLNRQDLHTLHHYMHKVCAQNSDKQCSGYAIMQDWLNIYVIITKYFGIVLFVSVLMIVMFPIIYFVFYGETADVLPLDLPFNDKTTALGYFVLTMFQVSMVLVGGFGLLAADLSMGLFFLYIAPLSNLVKLRFGEINTELLKSPQAASSRELNVYLRNLIETHKDTCR